MGRQHRGVSVCTALAARGNRPGRKTRPAYVVVPIWATMGGTQPAPAGDGLLPCMYFVLLHFRLPFLEGFSRGQAPYSIKCLSRCAQGKTRQAGG